MKKGLHLQPLFRHGPGSDHLAVLAGRDLFGIQPLDILRWAAGITLDKTAPASVLLGKPVPYTLKASNPAGNDPLYNVSFSDVLPAGFEYVGPTNPASAGEPAISTAPGGQTVLTWTNITDLQQASSFTIDFKAKLKDPLPTTIVPTDTNTAYVSGSTNERDVPKFNADGTPKAGFISSNDTASTARAQQSASSPAFDFHPLTRVVFGPGSMSMRAKVGRHGSERRDVQAWTSNASLT
mgnify:CR=1 FL=1